MAKWSCIIKEAHMLLVMPPLVTDLEMANILPEKVKVLQQYFYPSVEADFTDIINTIFDNSSFKNSLTINCTVDT